METLTIKLKQHTPIIHFQHDQDGATLRGSDVKPRLDKFILTRLGGNPTHEQKQKGQKAWENYKTNFNKGKKKQDQEQRTFDELTPYKKGTFIAKAFGWLVGKGDYPALNYKMKIVLSDNSARTEYLLASFIKKDDLQILNSCGIMAISNTPFFAQEKQNKAIIEECQKLSKHNENTTSNSKKEPIKWNAIEKKGIIESGYVIVSILSDIDALLDRIKDNIQAFFVANNFGSRQSKGFGCFQLMEIVHNNCTVKLKQNNEKLLRQEFSVVYKRTGKSSSDICKILQTINNDYKLLKSGINTPSQYKKSVLFDYFIGKHIRWEKRKIKQCIKTQGFSLKCTLAPIYGSNVNTDKGWDDPKEFQYAFIRALLGMSSNYEFQLIRGSDKDTIIVSVLLKGEEIKDPSKEKAEDFATILGDNNVKHYYKFSSDIERYRSPLMFKVIGQDIYLVGNEVSNEIKAKDFIFRIHDYRQGKTVSPLPKEQQKDIILSTPSNFSIAEFMNFACSRISYNSCTQNTPQ